MEDKRLILNFMGVEPTKFNDTWSWSDSPFFYCQGGTREYVLDSIAEYVKYDTSWDALMPVVNKCFETGDNTNEWDKLFEALSEIDIEVLYKQVVEFIKSYNELS